MMLYDSISSYLLETIDYLVLWSMNERAALIGESEICDEVNLISDKKGYPWLYELLLHKGYTMYLSVIILKI